jgi:hypothetical protein
MFEYRLEHIMSYIAKLGTREVIGPVPEGLRANVHVIGGEVTGPSTYGKFLPVERRLADDPQRWGRYP